MQNEPEIIIACDDPAVEIIREVPRTICNGVEEYALRTHSPQATRLRHIMISWRIPQSGIFFRWHPAGCMNRSIPPDWASPEKVESTRFMPLMQLLGSNDCNVLTFAFSDSSRPVAIKAAVVEESSEILCEVDVSFPEIAIHLDYSARLLIDRRTLFYAEVLKDTALWMEQETIAVPVPESAWEPAYSSWYSYHQHLSENEMEKQCRLARFYGMKTVILDDGWQTEDGKRGYAFCGDWEPDPQKFPDFKAHVERVHQSGFRYILWCALSLIGVESRAYEKFKDKILGIRYNRDAVILDPRYPEVRNYLTEKLTGLMQKYDLDGLKLDFIDSFLQPSSDRELPPECDCVLVGDAVEKLISAIYTAVSAAKPDFLIEFRQQYIGPRMRCHAPILRATDSPGDILSNRVRTIDLRLSCPGRAVHSDMLTWNYGEPAESAALQLLNVLFSVPQISLRLDEISMEQREMLDFWMHFFLRFRQTLLHGVLRPLHPELNYPLIYAENDDATIAVAYLAQLRIDFRSTSGKNRILINASGEESEFILLADPPLENGRIYNASGKSFKTIGKTEPCGTFKIPPAGVLIFGPELF